MAMKTKNYFIYLFSIVGVHIFLLLLSIDFTFEWCSLFFVWVILFMFNQNRFNLIGISNLFSIVEEKPNDNLQPKSSFKINFLMILPIIINIFIGAWI